MRSLQHLPAVRVHMRTVVPVLSEEAERGVAFGQLDAQPRASAGAFAVLASNSQIQADEAPRRWPGCRAGLPVVAAASESRLRPTTALMVLDFGQRPWPVQPPRAASGGALLRNR